MNKSGQQPRSTGAAARCLGKSGLLVPPLSLGLWQNFGDTSPEQAQRDLILRAFDRGVVHFDLANNYGPPPGAAEANLGRLLRRDLAGHRAELLLSTKAGYRQWPGPYGEGGSRKYLLSALDQSLGRLGLDSVDIFYSHRFDPNTPLEETIGALSTIIASGRAQYVGISSYSARRTREALEVAADLGVPLHVHQPSYSLLNRWIEDPGDDGIALLDVVAAAGLGVVAFSPLAQGLLTDKYLTGVPADSRAARGGSFSEAYLSESNLASVARLAAIAADRGQRLAQLALTWALRDPRISTLVIGARTVDQLDQNLDALDAPPLSQSELAAMDAAATDGGLNLWAARSSNL